MEYSNEYINQLLKDSVDFVDKLVDKYHYPSNIYHLLYLIVPAFILKYGPSKTNDIKQCFLEIPIIIDDSQNQVYQAYYVSVPKYLNNEIMTVKSIVLKNYKNIGLMQLLDNLVHELNHAINSFKNEIKIDDFVYIRTGISYLTFSRDKLEPIKKRNNIILEEVINTKQTELIIDVISSLNNYEIESSDIKNTLYSVWHSIDSNYKSNAYLLQSYICQELMSNKTFLSTLENLRYTGEIDYIYTWFDDITGKDGSFKKLVVYLEQSLELQKNLVNVKWFKKNKINKIRDINNSAMEIIDIFNRNCNYR